MFIADASGEPFPAASPTTTGPADTTGPAHRKGTAVPVRSGRVVPRSSHLCAATIERPEGRVRTPSRTQGADLCSPRAPGPGSSRAVPTRRRTSASPNGLTDSPASCGFQGDADASGSAGIPPGTNKLLRGVVGQRQPPLVLADVRHPAPGLRRDPRQITEGRPLPYQGAQCSPCHHPVSHVRRLPAREVGPVRVAGSGTSPATGP